MKSTPRYINILFFLILISAITFVSLSKDLFAISATIQVESSQERSDDIVTLKVSGLTHVETSGFKIRINYNESAFEYISTDFPNSLSGASKTASTNNEGILTIECSNFYLPIGENDYFSINLRAKGSGAATVLVATSTFYDLQGNYISGSMLKYFTVEIKPFGNSGSLTGNQGNPGQLTTVTDTPKSSSSLTDVTKKTTKESNKNSDNTTKANHYTTEPSTTGTSNTFSTEEINKTDASKIKYDFRFLLLISGLIVLVFLVLYIFKIVNKNKKR